MPLTTAPLRLVAPSVCAASRSMVSLAQKGKHSEGGAWSTQAT